MTTRLVALVSNENYHIYNRGVDKRTIFLDSADYKRFVELLYVANAKESVDLRQMRISYPSVFEFNRGEPLVAIGAYCLMPNHFHLLLTPLVEGGVTKFMGKVSTGYSMYFNKRYGRTGALFQGKFKAEHANTDEYLKYLYSYIHLNPVKLIDPKWKEVGTKDAAKSFDFAASFQYSSFFDYLRPGSRSESAIINNGPFPEYFNEHKDLKTELFDWLTYENSTKAGPL